MKVFEVRGRGPRMPILGYAPGVVMIALGLCILLMPDLLRYLVAAFFLGLGALLVLAAGAVRAGRAGGAAPFGDLLDRFRPPRG